MKKTMIMYIKFLIGMMLLSCLSCDTTKPDKMQVFNVSGRDEWNNAIDLIKANGDDQAYIINIQNSFAIQHFDVFADQLTFGDVQNVSIDIRGNNSQPILTESFPINIGPRQDVKISDITLKGISLGVMSGGRCSLYGNTLVTENTSSAVFVQRYGRFYMNDNSRISNTTIPITSFAVRNFGHFYLQGHASITDNMGFAVRVDADAFFYMKENASISRNRYGVSVYGGTFILEDGSLSENYTTDHAGRVVFISTGHFDMLGGSIHKNRAANTIYVMEGSFTMSGGIVYGNVESGAPEELANSSQLNGTTLIAGISTEVKYGDGSNILPHIDGSTGGTNHTIVGKNK